MTVKRDASVFDKVLAHVTEEWQTTKDIAEKCGMECGAVTSILTSLKVYELVERDEYRNRLQPRRQARAILTQRWDGDFQWT